MLDAYNFPSFPNKAHPNTLQESGVPPVTAANPSFNFDELLKASIQREEQGDLAGDLSSPEFDYLFSASPLPSPTPSPPPSPISQPAKLPDEATASTSASKASLPLAPLSADGAIGNLPLDSTTSDTPGLSRREAKQRAKSHSLRREKRQKARQETFAPYKLRKGVEKRYIDPAMPIHSGIEMEKASVTEAGFVGLDNGSGRKRTYALNELCGDNSKYRLKYVPWDGVTPTPVTDNANRIITILAGQPGETDWGKMERQGRDALENARSRIFIPPKDRTHRRGAFPALRCGVSHGQGPTHPHNLNNTAGHAKVLDELSHLEPFVRLSGFASSVMASWAPDLYRYYAERLDTLHSRHPELERLFPSSIFAAASYNFGPRTACFKHTDFANLPFGLCAVTSFGSFDPKKGGHLVLWDLGLVIEFPPGSTILLPSAVIAHSNVPVARHETRYSFAQYTAGGIFRWVENKCQLQAAYHATLSKEQKAAEQEKNKGRWAYGLSLFSVLKKKDAELPASP